ncbi:hypothetical protein HK44_023730 [Pseudomonas fluorescens HK44]|uniref:Fimbrial-type adhesion domain-containing protein n=2 Tax=Pseudomonas fluorescens TaxID=294 RepID=A0A010SSF8_PSEFL|nr:hypothetical protein HK44_023730 [Pseudomonas fluorescens HK44]
MSAGQNFTGTFSGLQIFKIGNVSSGSLPAGTIGTMRAGTNNVDLLVMKLSNSITVIEASCQTPTVHVNLGKHRISEFGAVGSTVGQTPFNIRLDNCPSGLSGISYQLDPITPAFNASQGILTVSGGGASGVGIQITDENNASVRLGERLRFLDTPPSGNLTIPLRAAYYKTAQQVSSGPANAAMQFTITYQ